MALTIEDGSGVPNANSYVSVAEVKDYADQRGISLPPDNDLEKLIVEAFDYVESFRSQFRGKKTNYDPSIQTSQFPRTGVVVDGWEYPENSIPGNLKLAQCQATCDSYSSGPLMPSNMGASILREKIDVLEVQYAQPQDGAGMVPSPSWPKVDSLLSPLFSSGGWNVEVKRG